MEKGKKTNKLTKSSFFIINAFREIFNFLFEKRREMYEQYFDRASAEKKLKIAEKQLWCGWLRQAAESCGA